jgi:hypothetical protein
LVGRFPAIENKSGGPELREFEPARPVAPSIETSSDGCVNPIAVPLLGLATNSLTPE